MAKAVAPFDLDSFDEEPPFASEPGVTYAGAQVTKTFHGDLDGTGTVEMLSVRAEAGGAGYVAVERITGSLHGRTGTLALLHVGTMDDAGQWAKWVIVPGSGTGELVGITGEGRIDIDDDGAHTLTLDYDVPA